jgi:FKBP-type peptidyl-prolyl cis-trans isomerase FkpA
MRRLAMFSLSLALVSVSTACQRPAPAEAPRPQSRSKSDDLPPMLPGIEKEDIALGTGPEAKKGDRVVVHYTGRLLNGTQFDSSLDRGVPFDFVIGQRQVIEGWEDGIVGMRKGGKRRLKIPPHLAYGRTGSPPKIGPDETLLFDIELLDIVPAGT